MSVRASPVLVSNEAPVTAAKASLKSSTRSESPSQTAMGTGASLNAFEKRSSLSRSAVSVRLRASRSIKVNSMQGSSCMSMGWPATITNFVSPFASFTTPSRCGMVLPSFRLATASSLFSPPSSTSSS
ncbi:hypothetical protein D3C71_1699620 [compost metagenome]